MELIVRDNVAKFKFIPNNKHFLYCEIYDDKYGIKLFVGSGFKSIDGSWDKVRFDTSKNPITEKGLYDIILEYRREILVKIMEEE